MITKCIFPVAGLGTRFLPITKTIPKEMLPIGVKPLIEYAIQEAMDSGIKDMGIITNKYKKAIEDYFDYNFEIYNKIKNTNKERALSDIFNIIKNVNFAYTRQKEIKGLGDAILSSEILTANQPFAVILADDLCVNNDNPVLKQMIDLYKKYQCSIVAVEEIDIKDSNKYGIISGSEIENGVYKIDDMIEKPEPSKAPTNLAIIGRYIISPDIFSILRETKAGKGGEIQITDALLTQAKKTKVLAYKFKGKRFDCGTIDGFLAANNYFKTQGLDINIA